MRGKLRFNKGKQFVKLISIHLGDLEYALRLITRYFLKAENFQQLFPTNKCSDKKNSFEY